MTYHPTPQTPGVPDHGGGGNTALAPWIKRARKFLVGLAGLAAQVVAGGTVDGDALLWTQAVLAVLTAAGIYGVPNAPDPRTSPPN